MKKLQVSGVNAAKWLTRAIVATGVTALGLGFVSPHIGGAAGSMTGRVSVGLVVVLVALTLLVFPAIHSAEDGEHWVVLAGRLPDGHELILLEMPDRLAQGLRNHAELCGWDDSELLGRAFQLHRYLHGSYEGEDPMVRSILHGRASAA